MTERLLVYSTDHDDLVSEYGGFLIQVNMGDHASAHYAVDNMFALDEWKRFDPTTVNWRAADINVLGTFGSITELRQAYLSDLAVKSVIDANRNEEDEERQIDEELFREEFKANAPLIGSVQETVIGLFERTMRENGVSIAQTEGLVTEVRDQVGGNDFKDRIIETRTRGEEQALWLILYADISSRILPVLIEYYVQSLEAPYTVLIDPADLDPRQGAIYHNPKIKMTQTLARESIRDLLEDIDSYNDTNLSLDGTVLFDEQDLDRARQIVCA